MYLHLGMDKVITFDNVVGIFDLDNTTVSKNTREYLAKAEKAGRVVNVCTDLPKSFIVCRDESGTETVFISQISSATLLKRTEAAETLLIEKG